MLLTFKTKPAHILDFLQNKSFFVLLTPSSQKWELYSRLGGHFVTIGSCSPN